MRCLKLLPILALLPLSACIGSQDQLLRSNTSLTIPYGAVHIPPRDSGLVFQGSIAASGTSGGTIPVRLYNHLTPGSVSSTERSSTVVGPATMETAPFQLAIEGSAFFSEHVRFACGLDASSKGLANWSDIGARFGKSVSIEAFLGTGTVRARSDARWNTRTVDIHPRSTFGDEYDTLVTDTATDHSSRTDRQFYRVGLNVSARQGGPLVEYQLTSIDLLDPSPRAGTTWGTTMHVVTVGWSEPTRLGTATLVARTVLNGKAAIPSIAIQWTGEFKP